MKHLSGACLSEHPGGSGCPVLGAPFFPGPADRRLVLSVIRTHVCLSLLGSDLPEGLVMHLSPSLPTSLSWHSPSQRPAAQPRLLQMR